MSCPVPTLSRRIVITVAAAAIEYIGCDGGQVVDALQYRQSLSMLAKGIYIIVPRYTLTKLYRREIAKLGICRRKKDEKSKYFCVGTGCGAFVIHNDERRGGVRKQHMPLDDERSVHEL